MKIEHLAIWTENIELLRDFYIKYFNFSCGEKYVNPNKNFTSYFLFFDDEKTRIELMHIPNLRNSIDNIQIRGLAHFAISANGKDNVNSITANLLKDGFSIISEPRTTGDGYYESTVLDPEGNHIEITE